MTRAFSPLRPAAAPAVLAALSAAVLAVCGALAAAAPARASRLVTWVIHSRYVDVAKAQFNSPPPGDPRQPPALRVDVLLPDGYDGHRRFPLLLLLHGHGDSYRSWMNPRRGDLPALAPHFPGVVVMPEAAQGWYTDWWDGGRRGSDGRGWERYMLEEVLPTVQRRLRILPGRGEHAVAGLSMGGEGAIYIAEQRPDFFGSAASFSGTLSIQRPEWPTGFGTQGQNYGDVYGPAGGFYATGHNPTAIVGNLRYTRVFVRVGDGVAYPYYPGEATNYFGAIAESDLLQHAQDFVRAADSAGVSVHYEPTTGIHDWPWWRAAFLSALRWGFFATVPRAPSSWRYETVAQTGRAWDLRFRFTAAPTAVETFTRSGSRLTASGVGTVRIIPDRGRAFTAQLPFTRTLRATAPRPSRRRHVLAHMDAAAASGGFRVGAAKADIDPAYPVYMGGYGGGPAGGTIARHLDPITRRPEHFTVRAIAIGAAGRVVELATVDTQGYFAGYQEGPYGLTDIRAAAASFLRSHGVPGATPADIVISSEHEHASPTLLGIWGPPEHQLAYLRQVARTLTATLERAYERMRPAVISWGQADVPWVADRVISEGNAFEGWPRDGSLGAIWARDARTGSTIATYVSDPGYPNIVYGPGDLLGSGGRSGAVLSSDFPNYADDYISSRLGGITILTQGTLGNQTSALQTDSSPSPDLPRMNGMRQTRAFDDIIHMGRLFAQVTLSALASGHRLTKPLVAAAEQHITTPVYNPILIADDKISTVPGGGAFLTALSGGALYPTDRAFSPPYGDGTVQLSTWVTGVRIGDLLLTTMPGEFFPSTHETWLKAISGPAANFVIGAGQDFLGYEYPVYAYPFTLEGSDEGIFNPSLTLGDQVVQAGEQDAQALGFHADLTTNPEYTATENQYTRQFQPGVQFIPFPQSGDLAPGGRGFTATIEGISQPSRDTTSHGACLADTYTSCPSPPPPMGDFHWSFGDGTTAVTPPQTYARAYFSPFLHHRYCRPGTYRVTVSAADSSGATDEMTLPVVVHPTLSLRIRPNGRTLLASARGGTGSLLVVSWRIGRRVLHGPVFRAPAGARAIVVTGADATGTVVRVRLVLRGGRLASVRSLAAGQPPLSDSLRGRC